MTNDRKRSITMFANCTIDFDATAEAPKPRHINMLPLPQQLQNAQEVCQTLWNGMEVFGKIADTILSAIAQWRQADVVRLTSSTLEKESSHNSKVSNNHSCTITHHSYNSAISHNSKTISIQNISEEILRSVLVKHFIHLYW